MMLLARGRFLPPMEFGLILLLGILWGSPYALTKISLGSIPPITLVAARVSLAAAVLWLIAIARGQRIPRDRGLLVLLFLQGIISCVAPYTLIAFGQQTVQSGLAAILNSTTPLFVCVIGVLWTHHEPVTPRRVLGAMIGFAGVVVVAGAGALLGLGQQATGQAAIIVATLCSAFGVIQGRRFESLSPELVAAGMLTSAAIVMLPLSIAFESPWHVSPTTPAVIALLINAVIATALGFAIYFRLIRTVGSMATASVGYLKPAVGVLLGSLVFGEPFTLAMAFGLLAILVGVAAIKGNNAGAAEEAKYSPTPPAGGTGSAI